LVRGVVHHTGDRMRRRCRPVALRVCGSARSRLDPGAGAADAVRWCKRQGLRIVLVTNTLARGTTEVMRHWGVPAVPTRSMGRHLARRALAEAASRDVRPRPRARGRGPERGVDGRGRPDRRRARCAGPGPPTVLRRTRAAAAAGGRPARMRSSTGSPSCPPSLPLGCRPVPCYNRIVDWPGRKSRQLDRARPGLLRAHVLVSLGR
jgi:hypothetical protein